MSKLSIKNDAVKVDVVSRAEITIKRTAKEVWPYLLMDQENWLTDLCIETVAGEKNQEGELKSVTLRDLGEDAEPFFFKTLLVLPDKQFIYKAFTDGAMKKGIYDGYYMAGYEMLTLVESNSVTQVIFNALLAIQHSKMDNDKFDEWGKNGSKASETMWIENLQRLKNLVEQDAALRNAGD